MKTVFALIFAALAASASAFAPVGHVTRARPSIAPLAMSKAAEESGRSVENAAALAAFASFASPLAAFADLPDVPEVGSVGEAVAEVSTAVAPVAEAAASSGVDEAVLIGYGAGLVACVTFFAVGFSIGYGALVKP
eukprot:CAMPEP_0197434018 /NCGR_PEP_ID=MMETSP1175-20131217/1808_1 /TAXON_ID=1003142 /ORGANISM="Triceratium dubium, Strain CCMP147" /LENGTH=135 /DNA_ID=CAMNT_0042962585 /DNA_START=47 /DNA_END=454 /DNA_ORIENTATION=+